MQCRVELRVFRGDNVSDYLSRAHVGTLTVQFFNTKIELFTTNIRSPVTVIKRFLDQGVASG